MTMHFTGRQTELAHLHAAANAFSRGPQKSASDRPPRYWQNLACSQTLREPTRALPVCRKRNRGPSHAALTGFGRRTRFFANRRRLPQKKRPVSQTSPVSAFLGRSSALGRRCGPVKSCLFINARHQIHRLHGLTGSALHKVVFHDKNHQKVPALRTVHGNASKV